VLQAGKTGSNPEEVSDFSTDLTLPAALWPCGQLSLLTGISTRNLPGGKDQPVHKADLTAICGLENVGGSTSHNPNRPSRPVTGIALPWEQT
jgi:hypothetical protein